MKVPNKIQEKAIKLGVKGEDDDNAQVDVIKFLEKRDQVGNGVEALQRQAKKNKEVLLLELSCPHKMFGQNSVQQFHVSRVWVQKNIK